MKVFELKINLFILFLFFNTFIFGNDTRQQIIVNEKNFSVEKRDLGVFTYLKPLDDAEFKKISQLTFNHKMATVENLDLSSPINKLTTGRHFVRARYVCINSNSDANSDAILNILCIPAIQHWDRHTCKNRSVLKCVPCSFKKIIFVVPPNIILEEIIKSNWRACVLSCREENPDGLEVCKQALMGCHGKMLSACRVATALHLSSDLCDTFILPYLGNAADFLQQFKNTQPDIYRPYCVASNPDTVPISDNIEHRELKKSDSQWFLKRVTMPDTVTRISHEHLPTKTLPNSFCNRIDKTASFTSTKAQKFIWQWRQSNYQCGDSMKFLFNKNLLKSNCFFKITKFFKLN